MNNLRIVRSAHVFAPSIGGVGASGSQSNAQSFSQSQNFNQGIGGLPFGGTSGLSISSSSSNANSQSFSKSFFIIRMNGFEKKKLFLNRFFVHINQKPLSLILISVSITDNGFNQGIGGYPGLGGFIPQIGGFGYGK